MLRLSCLSSQLSDGNLSMKRQECYYYHICTWIHSSNHCCLVRHSANQTASFILVPECPCQGWHSTKIAQVGEGTVQDGPESQVSSFPFIMDLELSAICVIIWWCAIKDADGTILWRNKYYRYYDIQVLWMQLSVITIIYIFKPRWDIYQVKS